MWLYRGNIQKSVAMMPMAGFGAIKAFEPQRWICRCSKYVYDPAQMDGVAFEEQSKKWKCPSCGAKKKAFRKTNKYPLS
ncbi:rubredoxin [Terasakiella sp.]|uniref:rubredoxin n=1 Tax=Terasakiella sp. TaxID=2034861 RepID=UPI003AA9C833